MKKLLGRANGLNDSDAEDEDDDDDDVRLFLSICFLFFSSCLFFYPRKIIQRILFMFLVNTIASVWRVFC